MEEQEVAFGAEAVIDEIDLLEAVLHSAAGRGRPQKFMDGVPLSARSPQGKLGQAPLSPRDIQFMDELMGGGTEAANMVYGLQLKAWVDMQVDNRVELVYQGLFETRLAAVEQERFSAVGDAQYLQRDLDMVKSSQARLVEVAQDISDDLTRLKLRVEKEQKNGAVALPNSFSSEQGSRVMERLAAQERALAEMCGLQEGCRDLLQEQSCMRNDLAGMKSGLEKTQGDVAESRHELSGLVQLVQALEQGALEGARRDVTVEACRSAEVPVEAFDRADLELMQTDISSALEELRRNLSAELQSRQNQMRELRAEMSEAFKGEATAVATLERQLGKMSREVDGHQRRLDDLLLVSQRRSNGKLICSPAAESFSNTVISPRTMSKESAGVDAIDHEAGDVRPVSLQREQGRPMGSSVLRFGRHKKLGEL